MSLSIHLKAVKCSLGESGRDAKFITSYVGRRLHRIYVACILIIGLSISWKFGGVNG